MRIPVSQALVPRRRLLLSLLLSPLCFTAGGRRAASEPAPPVDLLVESNGDLLEFNPKELSCRTGARVRLTFHHTGKYVNSEHNWVLIKPHSFDAVTEAAVAAGETNGWVPQADAHILAATPLCGKGQQVVVEFIAPEAGDYPFICSFPGHGQSMWGVLHVTAA
jgi:azurin